MEDEVRPLFDEVPLAETPPKKRAGGAQVLLIQGICCAVLVLLFWLFKVCGGSAYDGLRAAFQKALQDNTLLETAAGVFRERAPDAEYTVENGTVVTTVPDTMATTAVGGDTAETAAPTAAATQPTAAATQPTAAATDG